MRITKIEGLPVRSARRSIRVAVDNKHIRRGKRNSPSCCVIAEATKDGIHVSEVRVHASRLYIRTDRCWIRYELDSRVGKALTRFDKTGKFDLPFVPLYKARKHYSRSPKHKAGRRTGRNRMKYKFHGVRASPING